MKPLYAVLAMFLLISSPALAQTAPVGPIPKTDATHELTISPDGKWVVIPRTTPNPAAPPVIIEDDLDTAHRLCGAYGAPNGAYRKGFDECASIKQKWEQRRSQSAPAAAARAPDVDKRMTARDFITNTNKDY